ncbi:MAG: type II secretion system protein [Phycisphaerales bacterium]|nr:type II secretion system protein [Phycisphaerales bacterium]
MSERANIRQRGFTLIELLVVITIIAILVSLTLAAGTKVVSVGRERGTQWAMQALDTSVGEYIQANGAIPPPTVRDPVGTLNNTKRVAIVDALVDDQVADPSGAEAAGMKVFDSTAWYIHQLESSGSSALAAIHQIDPKLRKTGIRKGLPFSSSQQTGSRTTRILDVWGNPIRYVHPRFGGTHGQSATAFENMTNVLGGNATDYKYDTFLRDAKTRWIPKADKVGTLAPAAADEANQVGISDGGAAPSRRPYFYSAGPDGDPSTIEDNVYTIRPNLPR